MYISHVLAVVESTNAVNGKIVGQTELLDENLLRSFIDADCKTCQGSSIFLCNEVISLCVFHTELAGRASQNASAVDRIAQ